MLHTHTHKHARARAHKRDAHARATPHAASCAALVCCLLYAPLLSPLTVLPCLFLPTWQEHAKEHDLEDQGRALRAEYVTAGKQARSQGKQGDWGPDDAFYKVASDGCHNLHHGGYDYHLCFFQDIEQSKGSDRHSLGKTWSWTKPGHSGVFAGGKRCPGGPDRETRVTFKCGLGNTFNTVAETERCIYSITFTTPAACV